MPANHTVKNIADKKKIEDSIKSLRTRSNWDSFSPAPYSTVNINEANRKRQLENDAYAQDITLKRQTLKILFGFLSIETVAIFVFSFFQAINFLGRFHLEEWSFKLLVAATITQITFMLQVAVNHLFPKK